MAWVLNRTGLTAGVYRGWLVATEGEATPPALEAVMGEAVLCALAVAPEEGGWRVEGDLGAAALTEGARSVVLRGADGGEVLDVVTVVTGLDAAHDLRAELEALRVEVTQLKRAFRRHVRETE